MSVDSFYSANSDYVDSNKSIVYKISKKKNEFDYIFLIVHGVSFSSKYFTSNLYKFKNTLEAIDNEWFWNKDYTYHIELIDWKNHLYKYQENFIMRLSGIDSSEEKKETWSTNEPEQSTQLNKKSDGGFSKTYLNSTILKAFSWINDDNDEMLYQNTTENDLFDDSSDNEQPTNIKEFEKVIDMVGIKGYLVNIFLDILFHTNPRYGNYIVSVVSKLLNRRVKKLRNSKCGRYKNSKIILIGHSLGSLILYELMANAKIRPVLADSTDQSNVPIMINTTLPSYESSIIEPLEFDVSHVFYWGSPLGAYITIKNYDGLCGGKPFANTRFANTKLYNIFNKHDPIAVRLEPVFYSKQENIPPCVEIKSTISSPFLRKGIEYVKLSKLSNIAKLLFDQILNREEEVLIENKFNSTLESLVYQKSYAIPDIYNKFNRFGNVSLSSMEKHDCDTILNDNPKASVSENMQFNVLNSNLKLLQSDTIVWTVRQILLNLTKKIRQIFIKYVETKIHDINKSEAEKKKLIYDSLLVIDKEIAGFYETTTGITNIRTNTYDDNITIKEWYELSCFNDLDNTKSLCKKELLVEFNEDLTDMETEAGRALPCRLDFCSRETIGNTLFSPFGFLKSHLKYWSCNDICFFMLRQLTQSNPQVSRKEKDYLIKEGHKCRLRIYNILSKLLA